MLSVVAGKPMPHNKVGTAAQCERLMTNMPRSLQVTARTVGWSL